MHNEMVCASINLAYILSIDHNELMCIIKDVIEKNPDTPYYGNTSFDQTGKIHKLYLLPKQTLKLVISEIIDKQESESISFCSIEESRLLFQKYGY